MLHERKKAAEQVARRLFAAEAAIDTAISRAADLAAVMPAVREDARLSALIGQDAIESAIEAISALSAARRGIVETHKNLSVVQAQIGLGAMAMGGLVQKPSITVGAHAGERQVA
jgi:hypothetical protein